MTAQLISGLAGAALSLIFSYAPGASDYFDQLTPTQRRLVMAVLLLAVALAALVWQCHTLSSECLAANWQTYASALGTALVVNQGVYQLSPQPQPAPVAVDVALAARLAETQKRAG